MISEKLRPLVKITNEIFSDDKRARKRLQLKIEAEIRNLVDEGVINGGFFDIENGRIKLDVVKPISDHIEIQFGVQTVGDEEK
ncbi:MAG: hypothetical protein GTO63_34320 [Anaerolineae bacterium]|nr:hypothetical protein [Anaerolineae bacterium]NIN99716.1 hypothetical protein [Anaerolineae bacterium]NIQ82568.1 hypothetical protein [Anaerolineae bacterium]